MTYLAHIAGDGRKQTAAEHLNGTAERCALFAAPFGAEELGRLAGLSHDLGKYSMEFQRRLAGGPKVDHATAGAFACWRMGQPLADRSSAFLSGDDKPWNQIQRPGNVFLDLFYFTAG